MTSIQPQQTDLKRTLFIINVPLAGEKPTTPEQAKAFLSSIREAYAKDCAKLGKSYVDSLPEYKEMVTTVARLEPIAAQAANRVSSGRR